MLDVMRGVNMVFPYDAWLDRETINRNYSSRGWSNFSSSLEYNYRKSQIKLANIGGFVIMEVSRRTLGVE